MNEKRFSFVSMSGLRALMCAVLVAVGLAACSDKDDNPVVNPQLVEQIQGQWILINDFQGEDDKAYFDEEDFEDVEGIDPSIFDFHREVVYMNFEKSGNGSFIFFVVDQNNEPVGEEDDYLQMYMDFDYAIQPDGSIKVFNVTNINGFEDNEEFRFRYENGSLIADDGKQQFTLHRPSQAEAAQMEMWMPILGYGASADNYNINDEDFTAENWRKQEAIYIYDGQGKDVTDAKERTGYTLVNLPWYEGEVLTNLPKGFCDNITPENGWEWVLNRCGSRNIPNNNFFAVYNKYTGILRFFYYLPHGFSTSTGNDHVWQVSLTDNMAQKSLWGFGLPSTENFKDKNKLAATSEGTMVNYVTPWVNMRSDDGLILPSAGWWAFDVDLSLYRPGVDVSNESIKLQMISWNVQHVSLFSTLTASIEGSIKQTVQESNSTASDAAKGVMCGLGAAASVASAIAFGKGGNIGEMFGAIGNLFGCGSEFAGIFGGDDQPFEAEVSLGMKGTISTEGIIKYAVPTVGIASPTLRFKDFYKNGNHLGQGVWNITNHPKVYVIKDLRHDFINPVGILPEIFVSFPYFFDPRSVEVELNPEIFPNNEVEWIQVTSLCVASANTGMNGTDRWRAGYGLKSRKLGTVPKNITTIPVAWTDLAAPSLNQSGVKEFYDYMDYNRPDEDKKKVGYPIQVYMTGDNINRNREVVYGRGISWNYAIEPAFLKEIEPMAWIAGTDVPITMPDLMVNVMVTVKLKGVAEPISFSRNYLPEFETITRSEMESIADDCWEEYCDSYPRDTEYFSQLYRIKYLYGWVNGY